MSTARLETLKECIEQYPEHIEAAIAHLREQDLNILNVVKQLYPEASEQHQQAAPGA